MTATPPFSARWNRLAVGAATAATVVLGTAAGTTAATAAPAAAYYTPAQAKAKLREAGITWRSSGNCENKNKNGCTSFQGIRKTTVEGVIALKRASRCTIVITGAAEIPPHKTTGAYTHGKGYKVDVALNPCINRYIPKHARKIGSATWAAGSVEYFREGNHWDIKYKGSGSTTPASRAWPTLRAGSRGHAVTTAQQLLGINADGRYGPATGQAVKTFQRRHRLAADGVLGPATWQRLAPTLRSGAHGDSVKALQAQLRRHAARIAVDGHYGKATATAVRTFQRNQQLTADGVTGRATWRLLLTTS
ncbi:MULTISPECIES: peptidoglycan-binding domain-containing protein [Streptomyces]|uniref:peptidoglycan-binding domain-containing protein n=1 Tax=Streptomyces TaxID=1883 RepID=UPI001EFAA2B7|nr:peptidoglycan-binding protein [Streptomyces sp. CL12-4]MCG8968917.1 peptidoglycan-binding protein [Streptomyces sp. CL12-4]